jgi:hypothetical protein
VIPTLDPLRKLDLLRGGQQLDLADVLEEELQRVRGDVRPLGLDRVVDRLPVLDELDLELLDQAVELVDLPRVEMELVEREGNLVRIEVPRLASALKKLPGLLGVENYFRTPFRTCPGCRACFQAGTPSPGLTVASVPCVSTGLSGCGSLSSSISRRL